MVARGMTCCIGPASSLNQTAGGSQVPIAAPWELSKAEGQSRIGPENAAGSTNPSLAVAGFDDVSRPTHRLLSIGPGHRRAQVSQILDLFCGGKLASCLCG